ncbi:MAG: FtsW/RodA/SpoVE family cell cycle protein [Anaerolineae bacterium]
MAKRLRLQELALLIFPILLALMGFALLGLARTGEITAAELRPALLFAGALLVVYVAFALRGFPGDQLLLPLVATLTGLGLVLSYRLAPALAPRHLNWVLLGLGVMLLVALVPRDLRWLRRYRYTWALLGLALVALTLVFGRHPSGRGPRLWLGIGPFLFQPSELLKVLLVAFLAGYLDEKRELLAAATYRLGPLRLPPLPYLGPLLVMWGFSLLLLVWQQDLGAAFLFFGIFLAMLYIASARGSYVVGGLVLFSIGAFFIYVTFGHVRARFDIWLNPWPGARDASFQIVQSLIALASGGVLGQGLGYGHPTVIPAVHTDFVFVAIGEELGLVGALALVALYALLAHRGYRIALSAADGFEQLLAAGLTTILTLQTLIIMAGNIRLIPLTGVTLPFVSYGGSSLVMSFFSVGLLLRISE